MKAAERRERGGDDEAGGWRGFRSEEILVGDRLYFIIIVSHRD